MPQLTKNEAKKYLQELANRYWQEKGMTKKEYDRLCDEVSILPLDLTKYPQLSEESIKWINILFDEEDTDRNGNYMLRGFTHHERVAIEKLGCNYGDYTNGYSYFAYNKDEYLIYTYCEGDITLTILPDKETYDKEYSDTYTWYKEEYGGHEEEDEVKQTPPKEISDRAKAIMKRYIITGSCDEGYICNVIAYVNELGDGEGHFNGKTEIIAAEQTAIKLQRAYGCNIGVEDIPELEKIISTGELDKEKATKGIKRFIENLKEAKRVCNDEWRKEYITKEITWAKEALEEIQ